MIEKWKKIEGFETYEVSNKGRVRRNAHVRCDKRGRIFRIRETIIKPELTHNGYQRVGLYRQGKLYHKRVATLVAEAFIGRKPEGKEIDHADGCKTNNVVDNLRYVTHKENVNNPVTVERRKAYYQRRKQMKNPANFDRGNNLFLVV